MSTGRTRIELIVESDILSQAFGALLEQAGFSLDCRFGAAAAIVDASITAGFFAVARKLTIPWMVLANSEGDPDVLECLRAGARGYLLKTQPGEELVAAVRDVLAGGLYLSPAVLRTLVPMLMAGTPDCAACLAAHERALLKAIAEGRSMSQTAAALGLGRQTLRRRRLQLQKRIGAHSIADLVRYAVRQQIITP